MQVRAILPHKYGGNKPLFRVGSWVFPILFGGLYLLAYLFIGAQLLGQAMPHPVGQGQHDTPAGPIHGSITMGQTFWSPYPGLYRLDVAMATYARMNTHDVIFHLRESPTVTVDLATIVVNAREIEDNTWHRFEFTPIADAAGRTFYFFLESPTSTPYDAVTVYGLTSDEYKEGQAYLNGQPAGGDLMFLAYYQATPLDLVGMIPARLARGKPGWLGEPWFYVALFAAHLVLTTILLMGVCRWTSMAHQRSQEHHRDVGDPA